MSGNYVVHVIQQGSRLALMDRNVSKLQDLETIALRRDERQSRHNLTAPVMFFHLVLLDTGTCQKLRRGVCKTMNDVVILRSDVTLYSRVLYWRSFWKMSDAT